MLISNYQKIEMKRIDALMEYEYQLEKLAKDENSTAYDIYKAYITCFDEFEVMHETFTDADEFDEFARAYIYINLANGRPSKEEIKHIKNTSLKDYLYFEFKAQITELKSEVYDYVIEVLNEVEYHKNDIDDIDDLLKKARVINDIKAYLYENAKEYNDMCTDARLILADISDWDDE